MGAHQGKIAIITGGGSGIGKAIAEVLAKRGATTVLVDIDGDNAAAAAKSINDAGGRARAVTCDVVEHKQVDALVEGVVEQDGRVDYMFNNAGIALVGEVRDMSYEQWRKLIDVNITGVVNGIFSVYPKMIAQGSGHIINTASIAGLCPSPGLATYAMTKHAVVGVSTSLRGEAAAFGVKVSALCPGLIETPLNQSLTALNIDREKLLGDPLAKFVSAEYCADVAIRGMEKNHAIITATAMAAAMWRLYRLTPNFVASWVGQKAMERSRKQHGRRP